MKIISLISILVFFITISTTKVYAEPDPDFHIYLAFGQSNMEGQAAVEENEKTVDKRFQFIPTVEGCKNRTMGEWYDAIPPLPRCNGKAGIVDYFGRKMVKELPENIRIGIVAVAVSGANILLFDKDKYEEYVDIVDFEWYVNIMNSYGRNPYGRLIDMAKIAQKDGVIKGILLHQGENNINDEKWPEYVKKVYNNILEDLSLKSEEVPILVGEMARTELCGKAGEFNDIVKKLPDVLPTAHIISSKGLKPMKDCLHFSKEAYIELGERFANEMLSIKQINGTKHSKSTNSESNNSENTNSENTISESTDNKKNTNNKSDDTHKASNTVSDSSSNKKLISRFGNNTFIVGLLIFIISVFF